MCVGEGLALPVLGLIFLRHAANRFDAAQRQIDALDRKTVHRTSVLLPPARLLSGFDKFAKPVLEQMQTLLQQNNILRAVRDPLLPRLMGGALLI